MRRIISALLICFSTWALAQETKPLELAPDAPDRHIVVPGDTLWGIATLFLKDPYRWPEIWRLNKEDIKNPHRIYPGQVVILDRSGEQPQLKIGKLVKAEPRVYVDKSTGAIPAIPQNVIEPFLSQPLVVEPDTLQAAPRIVAFRGNRITVGNGDVIYVTGADAQSAKQWQIFRPGKPLIDPDTADGDRKVLGYEAVYLGTARKIAAGEPATFEITSAKQEVDRNDNLLPAPPTQIMSYVPHAPSRAVSGRIIKIYGGIGESGKFSIVSLSRGSADGLDLGSVLAVYRTGSEVMNLRDDKNETYKLPTERYGLLFVFRVFEHVSYALIMDAPRPVMEGDTVRNP
ncbi:MAG TPA: LysM peptidoglycan-binding domain-containing protein [Rhodocyclaceae bacterium]